MVLRLIIIVLGFIYGTEYILLGSIIGFAFSGYEYNRMMKYVEDNAYRKTEKKKAKNK